MNYETRPDKELPDRRIPLHLAPLDFPGQNTILFLTLCSKDRSPVLAHPAVHEILRGAWAQAIHWQVGRYMILPDHMHLFCAPAQTPSEQLKTWVAYWKRLASRQIRAFVPDFSWQADFWDTRIKRGESYAVKWEYVRGNAVRHGLAKTAEDWPYQGEMNLLHDNS